MNTQKQSKPLPEHLFVTSDGNLFDTRKSDWSKHPLREKYSYHFRQIETLAQVKATLRAGAFTELGGYPLYFITDDCQPLCFACARKQFRQVAWDFLNKAKTGWHIQSTDINYEDNDCYCCHCSKQIESAYGN